MKQRNSPFSGYASYYDLIYSDKNYSQECNFLEQIFSKYSQSPPTAILDAGCGTGSHLIPLAKRGYNLVGIDRSKEMLRIARNRSKSQNLKIELKLSDIQDFDLRREFDACICMFAVLGYVTKDSQILKALSTIRKHLRSGGLFIFDVWYGPAVIHIGPTARLKIVERNGLKLYRFAEPNLRSSEHICEVKYNFIAKRGDIVVYDGEEKHIMRYFFQNELNQFLKRSGFRPIKTCPFLRLGVKPSTATWDVVGIARAI